MTRVGTRRLAAGLGLCAALAFGAPATARAQDSSNLQSQLSTIETKLGELVSTLRPPTPRGPEAVTRRLTDGLILFELKDYDRASIVFLDIVEHHKDAPAYPEALYYFGESLFQRNDLNEARRQFQRVITERHQRYEQDAITKLIEIAIKTGETQGIDELFARIDQIGAAQLRPVVNYTRAKYHYFRGRVEDAEPLFQGIPVGSPFYPQARYFLGTILVQRKQYQPALAVYDSLRTPPAKDERSRAVQELAHLAMGRLLYELGRIPEAIDRYQDVPRSSANFDTALYEIAWAYVKAGQFPKALRALDLLLVAAPETKFGPEVKILEGNLLIRLNRYVDAGKVFENVRVKYTPIQNDLDRVIAAHNDPRRFFDDLVGKAGTIDGPTRVSSAAPLPPDALKWLRADPEMAKAFGLVDDVDGSVKTTAWSERTIVQIEKALASPTRVEIFPELARGRARALELEGGLQSIRQVAIQAVRSSAGRVGGEAQTLASEASQLEAQLRAAPVTLQAYEARARQNLQTISSTDRTAATVALEIDKARAQLVAMEKFYRDSNQGKTLDEVSLRAMAELRREVEEMDKELSQLRTDLRDEKGQVGVADDQAAEETRLRQRYREVVSRERALYAQAGAASQYLAVLDRADGIDGRLGEYNKRLYQLVDERLVDVRRDLDEEKKNVATHRVALGTTEPEAREVAGIVAFENIRNVRQRFYDLVVRSEVGVIDVAWARKQEKTDKIGRLVRQQKRDLKVLDEEFRDVLKEEN
jgi:tetratricopeptide (TPR) repeat protein